MKSSSKTCAQIKRFLSVLFLACKFDFEDGIDGWEKTGTVFNNQPTYGDNPTARHRQQPANQQGDWWIGGAEDRPCICASAGYIQGDHRQGTLLSPSFTIMEQNISFLIGGGCDVDSVRAELLINGQVGFLLIKFTFRKTSQIRHFRRFLTCNAFYLPTCSDVIIFD